ncbi:MAG: DUF4139 domain-containing protein, partial [Candidatus Eisenbacteria bacterium]
MHGRFRLSAKTQAPAAAALTIAALIAAAPAAHAADRELTVTVYNSNLALVKDSRALDLGQGRQTFQLTGVSAQIDPTSVHLEGQGGEGLAVLEQNYRFDLVSADKVLERYVDKDITVAGKDGKTTSGTLLSFDGGSLVINRKPGISIINRMEVKEVQFPDLPGGLITKPTLVWLLENGGSARRDAQLSYLTGGLSWHAEYVAVLDANDKNLSWSGWVSLENNSGTSYPDAKLKVVAGDVNRVSDETRYPRSQFESMAVAKVADQAFEEQSFFEYHLYTLARPTTLADKETKQLSLFPTSSVAAQKFFTYERQKDSKKVRVTMEFKNSSQAGLGMPLPMGKVRVYKEDKSGAQEFVGEDRIDHTPKDETVRLTIGNAFDVTGEYAQTDQRRISDKEVETSHQIKLRNHKTEPVTVKVVEPAYGDWRITTSSQDFVKKDARTIEFTVTVPVDGE